MNNPKQIAHNVLVMLQDDPRRYRNFGVYWYFIKALMKQFYTRDNLYLLGDYDDPDAAERLPEAPAQEILEAAMEEYGLNARFGEPPRQVFDHQGEAYTIFDEDAGI